MSNRIVTVALEFGGTMTIPCPQWCGGHRFALRPAYPVDVSHEGDETELLVEVGEKTFGILGFSLAQAPYGSRDSLPYGGCDLGADGFVRLTPDQIRALADGIEAHAGLLRVFATTVEEARAQAAQVMRPERMPADWPWPPERDGDEQ